MDEGVFEARERRNPLASALAVAQQDPGLAAILVMALAGIGVSIYLTVIHYAKLPAFCTTGGIVNCSSVLHSAYSNVPFTTIPISVPGLLWFVVSGGLAALGLANIASNRPEPARLRLAQFVWSAAGLLFVLYLVYAEIVRLHSICEWCTAVHLFTLLTFLIALNRLPLAAKPMPVPAEAATTRQRSPAQARPSTPYRPPASRRAPAQRQSGAGNSSRAHAQSRKR